MLRQSVFGKTEWHIMRLRILLAVIAASQFALGGLTLFAPTSFFGWMGLTAPPADNRYILGMLGARFLAYGIGMAALARAADPSLFWIRNMAFIQAVDLTVGLFYTANGTIGLAVSAFPMFNAAAFGLLLTLWGAMAGGSSSETPRSA